MKNRERVRSTRQARRPRRSGPLEQGHDWQRSTESDRLTLEELQKRADELTKNSGSLSPYAAAAARKEIIP